MNADKQNQQDQTWEPTVQALIEVAGKTQRELGVALGVTELSVNNWATGRKVPRVDNF
jgi:transcriptional regulator with XRE-family HTH domain